MAVFFPQSFLEGIESIEIAFFQQANFMGILKRNVLRGGRGIKSS